MRCAMARRRRCASTCGPNGEEALALDIVDRGKGLDAGWSDRPGHHGLRWLSERVEGLGGRLVIESAPPRGTRLAVRLPLDRAIEAAE